MCASEQNVLSNNVPTKKHLRFEGLLENDRFNFNNLIWISNQKFKFYNNKIFQINLE